MTHRGRARFAQTLALGGGLVSWLVLGAWLLGSPLSCATIAAFGSIVLGLACLAGAPRRR